MLYAHVFLNIFLFEIVRMVENLLYICTSLFISFHFLKDFTILFVFIHLFD